MMDELDPAVPDGRTCALPANGDVFDLAPSFLAVMRGPDHVFTRANQAYMELVGFRDLIGVPLRQALPEVAEQGFGAILDRVYQSGEPFTASELPVRLRRRGSDEAEEQLRVEGLVAGYGQARVLHGIDLAVNKGEIVGLLGRNGMGKSTLLNCLMGLFPPMDGSIFVDGRDVTAEPSIQRSRAGVSLVPQGRRILADLTVEEQLQLGARPGPWTLERVYELFPPLVDRKKLIATNLSGGEQQMLALGRVLMRNPAITLMDEPSEGLSPLMVQVLRNALVHLSEAGETVLLAEQNVPLALSVADRIYVLDRGRIVFEGRPIELRDDPTLLRRTLGV